MMDSQDTRGFLYMLNYVTKKDNDERSERGLESKGLDLEASRMLKVRAVQSEVGVVEPNRGMRWSRGWLRGGRHR